MCVEIIEKGDVTSVSSGAVRSLLCLLFCVLDFVTYPEEGPEADLSKPGTRACINLCGKDKLVRSIREQVLIASDNLGT